MVYCLFKHERSVDQDLMQSMKENQPIVSVIITAYNEGACIEKSLQSVVNQSYRNIEILVFTDGCTDNTVGVVKKLSDLDSRIILLESKENVGKGKGRNTAMENAKGDLLAIFDADDYMHPTRIEKQVKFFQENPEISILGTQLNYIDKNSGKKNITHFPTTHSEIWKAPFRSIPLANPSAMIRKKVFEAVRFKEELLFAQDYDLWFQSHNQGFRFANLEEVLVDYSSVSTSKWKSTKFQLRVKFYWLKNGNFPWIRSCVDIFIFLASVFLAHIKQKLNI